MILRTSTTEIDPAILERPVSGVGIADGSTLGDLVGSADRTTLLVFLRHYG